LRACSGAESIADAALGGKKILLGLKPLEELARAIALYRSVRAEVGASPEEVDRDIGEIPVLRRITIGESDGEARHLARKAVDWESKMAHRLSRGVSVPENDPPPSHDALAGGCVGTAETVRGELRRLGELGIRRIMAWVNFGDMPYANVRKTMESLASEVLPALRSAAAWKGENMARPATSIVIERTQTGVRIEKRILKVLKALADLLDLSLGDLLEGTVLHAFDGKAPFSAETRKKIAELKKIYGLELDASHSHRLQEAGAPHGRRFRDALGARIAKPPTTRSSSPRWLRGD
jgi:hypothetical protein